MKTLISLCEELKATLVESKEVAKLRTRDSRNKEYTIFKNGVLVYTITPVWKPGGIRWRLIVEGVRLTFHKNIHDVNHSIIEYELSKRTV